MNEKIIENATTYDIRHGDHLTWERLTECRGVFITETRQGTAHHRDEDDNWCTKEGMWIEAGAGDGNTITIRRPVKELPTESGIVIVVNDGHKAIKAKGPRNGTVWYTKEAMLGSDGKWYGVWLSDTASPVTNLGPKFIIDDTWMIAPYQRTLK